MYDRDDLSLSEQADLSDDTVYLKSGVKIEPLASRWYIWPHLVSPAQKAINIAFRYIPLLQSFVKNPAVHVAATKDPKLFGGPFVALPVAQIDAVKALIDQTLQNSSKLIEFANAIRQVDGALQKSARGYSLNSQYGQLPDILKGLVEFTYDLNNHPKIRLIEEFVYDALLSDDEEVMLSAVDEAEREFFMSTPRIGGPDDVFLKMPLLDPRIDMLARARTVPVSLKTLKQELGVADGMGVVFDRFFTTTPPVRRSPAYEGEQVRVRYFGHACILLQTNNTSILIDPMLAWEDHKGDNRYTFNDLPDHIDYVVLTHNHQDHCAPEMLMQLRHRVGKIVIPANNSGSLADPSMKLMLAALGYNDIVVMHPLDTLDFADGHLVSLPFPGEHVDLDIHTKHALHLTMKGRKFLFLVDSDGWDAALYRRIANRVGHEVDALFLGMECFGAPLTWLYGPLLTNPVSRRDDESRRLSGANCERAWHVIQELKTPKAYVYAMGQEPWLRFMMGLEYTPDSIQLKESGSFVEQCQKIGIEAERLYGCKEMLF